MKQTLIKLPEGLILCSDEEIVKGKFYSDGKIYECTWSGKTDLKSEEKYFSHSNCRKILSQSPKLSKEVADEIGFVDVEELANQLTGEYHKISPSYPKRNNDELGGYWHGFKKGFQKANELNQKKYTERQLWTAMCRASEVGFYISQNNRNATMRKLNEKDGNMELQKILQSLSQPQQWQVKAELIENVWNVIEII